MVSLGTYYRDMLKILGELLCFPAGFLYVGLPIDVTIFTEEVKGLASLHRTEINF